MSLWLQAKRREHPRSFLAGPLGRDKTLPSAPAKKGHARRRTARAASKRTGVKSPS